MGSLIHQHPHEEDVAAARSVINFKTGAAHGYHSCTSTFMQSTSTSTSNNSGVSNLLSFEQNKHEGDGDGDGDEGYPMWEENLMMSPHALVKSSSLDDHFFHKETYQHMMNHEDQDRDSPFGAWLYASQPALDHHCIQQSAADSSSILHKRPHLGENVQGSKKQCSSNGAIIKNKQKPNKSVTAVVSKDPQSIAAKNRRERISERLKILQELVPNGSKVDLVTMLEKAISYVKFLQLQVKVLATDEFWPVQGGKAPDISQVKEAIDAILQSSQRERNSTSSSKS